MTSPLPRDEFSVDHWLTDARAGSRDALGRVLEAYRPYLVMLARGELERLPPKARESDLLQETYLRAHAHFADFRGGTADELRVWLARILQRSAANLRRTYVETRKRSTCREVPLDDTPVPLVDPTPPPFEVAARREERERFEQALSRLAPDDQLVIRLYQFEGRAFTDIARHMGRSQFAVRKLWQRSLDRLRQQLEVCHAGE